MLGCNTYRRLGLVLLAVACLAACADSGARLDVEAAVTLPPGVSAGTVLPPPSALPGRSASGTYVIDPSAPIFWSPGETPADPFVMTAPAQDYRFAVYQTWPVNALAQPTGFVFNLDGSSGTVWLGLANYTRDRWEWLALSAPYSTWMELSLPGDGNAYFDGADNLALCLLAYDGDTLSFGGAHVLTSNHPYLDPAQWQVHDVALGSNFGKHSNACLLNNKPALVYTRDDSKDIYFALADSEQPQATADWASHAVAVTGDLGGRVDIAVSNGVPCLTYEDTVKQDIYFAAANSAEPIGAAQWAEHKPDASGQAAASVVDHLGVPMLLYICSTGLRFARALDPGLPINAAGWQTLEIDTGYFYDYPRLADTAGGPVLAYQRKDNGYNSLWYAWSDSIADGLLVPGASFTKCLVDDANNNSGNNIGLTTDAAGKAWIAYTNIDIVHFMKFAMANVVAPTQPAQFSTVTAYGKEQTHTGQNLSLADVQGRPLCSFIETGSGSVSGLHLAYPNRAVEQIGGPESFDLALFDPADGYFVNEESTLFNLADGRPAVVYRTSAGLKFGCYTGSWP